MTETRYQTAKREMLEALRGVDGGVYIVDDDSADDGTVVLAGQSDAEASAAIRDVIAESEARRQALIASGMNRHERRRQAAIARAKETR